MFALLGGGVVLADDDDDGKRKGWYKNADKELKEWEKDRREAAREWEKDRREALKEREKDRRESAKEWDKRFRERYEDDDRYDDDPRVQSRRTYRSYEPYPPAAYESDAYYTRPRTYRYSDSYSGGYTDTYVAPSRNRYDTAGRYYESRSGYIDRTNPRYYQDEAYYDPPGYYREETFYRGPVRRDSYDYDGVAPRYEDRYYERSVAPDRSLRTGARIGSAIGELIGGPEGAAIGGSIGADIGAEVDANR